MPIVDQLDEIIHTHSIRHEIYDRNSSLMKSGAVFRVDLRLYRDAEFMKALMMWQLSNWYD